MNALINRMRLQAEDLHVLNPTSETVKCLSLGADEIERLEEQLAASQAREAKLRECIANMAGNPRAPRFEAAFNTAMNLPYDDTTLRKRLKAERERCAQVCEGYDYSTCTDARQALAAMIRNLGDE